MVKFVQETKNEARWLATLTTSQHLRLDVQLHQQHMSLNYLFLCYSPSLDSLWLLSTSSQYGLCSEVRSWIVRITFQSLACYLDPLCRVYSSFLCMPSRDWERYVCLSTLLKVENWINTHLQNSIPTTVLWVQLSENVTSFSNISSLS